MWAPLKHFYISAVNYKVLFLVTVYFILKIKGLIYY